MRRRARPGGGKQTELIVESLGGRGDGVTSFEGRPVFLPGVLPGEKVLARLVSPKSGGYRGEIVELLETSPERVEPPCRHFGPCGGCALQMLEEGAYRRWKSALAPAALSKRGLEAGRVAPLESVPRSSRRRAALAAQKLEQGVVLGFHEQLSHRIVDLQDCLILRPSLFGLLPALRELIAGVLPPRGKADLHLLECENGLDLLIATQGEPSLAARERLAAFSGEHDLARLSWRDGTAEVELIAQRRHPLITLGDAAVEPQPGAFLQATKEGEAALARAVVDFLPKNGKRFLDLYSGLGSFTFPLAQRGSVHAVEGEGGAVSALQAAANRAGLGGRVSSEQRDLARQPLRGEELAGYDAILLDPPRTGAKEQCEMLAESGAARIIMLSCNPNSFARDARILADGGFVLEELRPIDQFVWTPHLELAASFAR
ncbi:class I SAM-dependent RNA methyltransferase [Limibacillus halophilus]